ncbi:MBL fold metallo-hydrolase [Scatolibacter rhodanostii]|uniref:MBL fold metallo-hydrolase n=1 Tax=Scatolibacter rhodanostii TaxID=2014781 RepID=UPI000C06AC5E|nr:MBL fold metallo-hydrolase [Scatolibacter rhodanostii]
MSFYKTEKLEKDLYKIVDILSEELFPIQVFLVIGKERAALIDTGIGIGSIKEEVEKITQLPIIVLHTHGHLDHVGGDRWFSELYLHPQEYVYSQEEATELTPVKQEILLRLTNDAALLDAAANKIQPNPNLRYLSVKEGDHFDLGGVILKTVEISGHTKGSIAFVSQDGRFAFTGDGIADIHWFDEDDEFNTIEAFLETLNHFEKFAKNNKQIYASHLKNPFTPELVHQLQTAANNILNGSIDDIEKADYLFLKHGYLYAHRVGNACIYYKKENIYKKQGSKWK